MTAAANILFVALDACDPVTARALAARGRMPALQRILRSWATCEVANPVGLYVGTLWTTFFTARSPASSNFHCWEEIAAGTYEWRLTSPLDLRGTPFWETLGQAGRRVGVIDVPHMRVSEGLHGVQVAEWGCHDRHFGFQTWPRALTAEITARFGLHPVLTVDPFDRKAFAPDDYVHRAGAHRTPAEERALLHDLLEGADRKRRLSAHYLARGPWDLFLTVFGESHSVGHQSWYLHDPTHPRHDPALAVELGDPLERVYERLDAALGEHLELAGPDTTVLVLLSHGMGPHYDGTHLLPELLRRLDRSGSGAGRGRPRHSRHSGRPRRSVAGHLAQGAWPRLPSPLRPRLMAPSAALLRRRLGSGEPAPSRPDTTEPERASQRFFPAPNNSVVGGIRINLVGREPAGRVRPGAEFDAVCEELTADLLDLVNVITGEPVVRAVEATGDHYAREPVDALPDLFVEWNHHAPVETVWSPRTGVVHVPYEHWRTGDHRPAGLLLSRGPGIPPGRALPPLSMIDLAPSLAARLGVPLPGVDGRPVSWLAEQPASAATGATPRAVRA